MSRPTGSIHAAQLTSPRLRRVLRVLSDGQTLTSLEIVQRARVLAVSSIIAELRFHGAEFTVVRQAAPSGVGTCFYYTMTKAPPGLARSSETGAARAGLPGPSTPVEALSRCANHKSGRPLP